MSGLDYIESLPVDGEPDRALFRNHLVKRTTYHLEPNEDIQTIDVLDPDTGELPQALGYREQLYWFDPDDLTSEHDGISVLVSQDGYIYKSNPLDIRIFSVKSRELGTPPESGVEFGDAWIIPAGADEPWADYEDFIAIWTGRGWAYRAPKPGDWKLVEDPEHFVRYSPVDGWQPGPGAYAHPEKSVPLSASIAWGRVVTVENATTTAPPASPLAGVAYLIPTGATGAWAGQQNKIAISETSGSFTIYTPGVGWIVENMATGVQSKWNGAAWVTQGGALRFRERKTSAAAASVTSVAGAGSNYSISTPLKTTDAHLRDDAISFTRQTVAGAEMCIEYEATVGHSNIIVGVKRDNDVDCIAWTMAQQSPSQVVIAARLYFTAIDAAEHTYTIILHQHSTTTVPAMTGKRTGVLLEFA